MSRKRLEMQYDSSDPLWVALAAEADLRNVRVQQHIYDVLRLRWLGQQGYDLTQIIGVPVPPAAHQTPNPPSRAAPAPPAAGGDDGAAAAFDVWTGMGAGA